MGNQADRGFCGPLAMAIFAAVPDGILTLEAIAGHGEAMADARVVDANQRACEILGMTAAELAAKTVLASFPRLVESGTWARFVGVLATGQSETFEFRPPCGRTDGWFRFSVVPYANGVLLAMNDITALKKASAAISEREAELGRLNDALSQQAAELRDALAAAEMACGQMNQEIRARKVLESELRRIADSDPLTGVQNRRSVEAALVRRLQDRRAEDMPLSIAILDLDHFKRINDRFGHAAGDDVLRLVTDICGDALRKNVDVLGRIGGEEFLIIMPRAEEAEARLMAEHIRVQLCEASVGGEHGMRLSASFGVATAALGESAEDLLARADLALYAAKQNGRNQVALARRAPRGELAA